MEVAETTDHILQCPTRETVHSTFYTKFISSMREKELPNDILELFDAGIDIALLTPLRFPLKKPTSMPQTRMNEWRKFWTMVTSDWIEERHLPNRQEWDGREYSWASLPLDGKPLQKTWIISGCLHAHAYSWNGDVPAGHTAITICTVLPNNNTNKNDYKYKQRYGFGLMRQNENPWCHFSGLPV